MSETKRKVFTGTQKAKIALEAVKGMKTMNEIAQDNNVHPTQVSQWKKDLLDNASTLFEGKRGPKRINPHSDPDRLYAKIGQLNMELDWLKKSLDSAKIEERYLWVNIDDVALSQQCKLLKITRSVVYAQKKRSDNAVDETESMLLQLLDEEYILHPFYGSRRMTKYLCGLGHKINRKRVQRLMKTLGLVGMAPGPNTSKAHPQHKIYPYLLRGVDITQPNQVWSTDITYSRLPGGFVYLVAIIDWYSRRVLSWRISNTMDTRFCIDCLEEAIKAYGVPEILKTDQGAQFTSDALTNVLIKNGVSISMDGRGRALDNIFVERLWRAVKYEEVYLKQHDNVQSLLMGLTDYFVFYNQERRHQSLGYATPDVVYQTATGGGAKIVDKYKSTETVGTV
ncbi:MAG: IS3 family transposase [Gammaproteobacteria bacterium]|nr:IS3 family transposase [Gammaproteobacteria bacterium]MBT5223638.1 IS3 family transposase [Gammaproteobacteria bacterium]MBT6419391.1 IS3 family transposase [Gammaproteobacteria bacterium]MBT7436684.1 IS3 family transposase [Gammaproteobacteria bacterium]